jgi:hypothetical protein
MSDTILDIKTKIYKRCAAMFSEIEFDEEGINNNLLLMHKDGTPSMKQGGKVECEFCGRHHNSRDDTCEINSEDHRDAN